MSKVVLIHWPEMSPRHYDDSRKEVNWEGDIPQGLEFHAAWFDSDGFHAFDLWTTIRDFEIFIEKRMLPGVRKLQIQGQPRVTFADTQATFANLPPPPDAT